MLSTGVVDSIYVNEIPHDARRLLLICVYSSLFVDLFRLYCGCFFLFTQKLFIAYV